MWFVLNILMVTLSLGMGGISRYIAELSNGLANKGHKVFILSMKESKCQLRLSNNNVKLIQLMVKGDGVSSLLNGYLKINKHIKNILRMEKIDLIINNTPLTNLICSGKLPRFGGDRSIMTMRVVHGMWGKELYNYKESRMLYGSKLMESILPIIGSSLEKYELNSSKNIIAVNDDIKKYIISKGVKRDVQVVSAGVNVNRFTPPRISKSEIRRNLGVQDKFTILFVGNLTEIKGANYLIESANTVLEHYDVQFLFVGDGINREKYLTSIKQKGIGGSVKFVGQVEDDLLPQFYQASDIFCLPSLQEGLPQTLLEAMSTGLPSIATNVGGISSILKDGINGFIIEPKNGGMLSTRIESLIRDRDIAHSIGHEARMTILAKYSWDIICDRILEILRTNGDDA